MAIMFPDSHAFDTIIFCPCNRPALLRPIAGRFRQSYKLLGH
jgi:hypothetical protein